MTLSRRSDCVTEISQLCCVSAGGVIPSCPVTDYGCLFVGWWFRDTTSTAGNASTTKSLFTSYQPASRPRHGIGLQASASTGRRALWTHRDVTICCCCCCCQGRQIAVHWLYSLQRSRASVAQFRCTIAIIVCMCITRRPHTVVRKNQTVCFVNKS